MRFSKVIVLAVVALNVAFTAAVLLCFWHTGAEPVALVGAWFAFTTAELWQLASIKKSKARGINADSTNQGNAPDQ